MGKIVRELASAVLKSINKRHVLMVTKDLATIAFVAMIAGGITGLVTVPKTLTTIISETK